MLGASKGPGIRRLTLWVIVTAKAPAGGRLLYPASAPVMLLLLQATAAVSPGARARPVGRGATCGDPTCPAQVGALVPSSQKQLQSQEALAGGNGGISARGGTPPPTPAGSAGTPTAGIPGQGWAPRKLGQRFPSTCWSSLASTPPPHRLLPSKGLASTSLLAPQETQKPESWGATNNCSPSRGVSGK